MDQPIEETFAGSLAQLEQNLSSVIRGKAQGVRLLLVALISGGHALLEDMPGTGKTTLAKSLARSINGVFRRVQFTPDLLPADITGSSFYKLQDGTFEFREGPIFTNVLLADEINRTSPRTQSALLEVMSENQATVEGFRHQLPRPFFVVATQNPSEYQGTYPLPEAQLDRFAIRLALGYPDAASEIDMLFSQQDHHPYDDLQPVLTCERLIAMQDQVRHVRIDASLAEYMVRLVNFTRGDARLRLGVSPRGTLALSRAAQASAMMSGRDYIIPEDIRQLAVAVLAHRIVPDTKAKYAGARNEQVIEDALEKTPVPK